jgi:NTP pyrophosphatase (non-canonical NTP hydrolase)
MKNKVIKSAKVIKGFPNNSGIKIGDILMYHDSRYHNVTIKADSYTPYYSIDAKQVENDTEYFELKEYDCNNKKDNLGDKIINNFLREKYMRPFVVGEKVSSPLIPKEYEHIGIVIEISEDLQYPILVVSDNGCRKLAMLFTIDGKNKIDDENPSLFHYSWTEKEAEVNEKIKNMSEFKKYAEFVESLKVYPYTATIIYPALGLCGEAGEVAEKIKKIIRDKGGVYTPEDKAEILKELGDVLFYVTALSQDLGFSLEDVAGMNVEKLMSRKERNAIHGNGDNR